MDAKQRLPLHIAAQTSVTAKESSSQQTNKGSVYNADFGRDNKTCLPSVPEEQGASFNAPTDYVIKDLLELYPEAASITDPIGKLPFMLALETGKSWKTCLEPLWEANPHVLIDKQGNVKEEMMSDLQHVVDCALTNSSPALRRETVRTLRHLAPLYPAVHANEWITHLFFLLHDCGEVATTEDHVHLDPLCWGSNLQASALEAVAALLGHVSRENVHLPDTPDNALTIAIPLLKHPTESIRMGAARITGVSAMLLGSEETDKILLEAVFGNNKTDVAETMETSSGSVQSFACEEVTEESPDSLHGRIMACHAILSLQPRTLTSSQSRSIKTWMKHDAAIVRKAACLVAGSLLSSSNDLTKFRSPLLKCMRANEELQVHLAVARGLSYAAKKHPTLFVGKAGMPLLDGALMLSLTTTVPSVKEAFNVFLWWALDVKCNDDDKREQDVLQEYMKLAEGENGRVMMSLVTTTLAQMQVDEGEEDDLSS